MPQGDLLTSRKSLDEICIVPDKIISVYSLEQHVWAGSNSPEARKARKPELKTIDEFQLDPVRPFLTDFLRNLSAPYNPERRENPIGQGWWVQAEFGSGKSHLLSFISAIALGDRQAWGLINEKETKANRGKRESLYHFWEDGLEVKNKNGKKGIFVVVKTLVGVGGGVIGDLGGGKRLSEYILDAVKEQIEVELGKNISLYPAEYLADYFITNHLDLYRNELRKFLKDPKYFEDQAFEDADDFIRDIQQNKSPDYKRSCGNKLWRFYTEHLKVQPHVPAETEDILEYMVRSILQEGYEGVLLVLDEVSLFMKDRDDNQRTDDEKTLVVLSNRLGKVKNLPIWIVCSAQQAIESKMGVKNIIADDRLKLVKLLEEDKDYYDIVLTRVREIKDLKAVGPYYLHYRRGFTWPNSIGEDEFRRFFPFHKPALEVLRAVTYELTTARSAIHFMHQTLKHQIKAKGKELIRLWELFDETVAYEEDPSGVHAGLVAIKTKKEIEYRAYEVGKQQIDGITKGHLKVYHDKALKTLQTLFLYHIAHTRQQGLTAEEIANSVLIERDENSTPDENNQHYETIAENLKKELRQIVQTFDEDKRARYRFNPELRGIDPRDEFRKVRDDAETNEVMVREAWERLLSLGKWPVSNRQMTINLSGNNESIFYRIAPYGADEGQGQVAYFRIETIDIQWKGRQVSGCMGMRDFSKIVDMPHPIPPLETDQTDQDFGVFVGIRPVSEATINTILQKINDPRILIWTPGELTADEKSLLLEFASYRKLVSAWQGKATEEAVSIINWVYDKLQTELGKILKIVENSYARGRIDAMNHTKMSFHVAGELTGILTPLIDRVLSATYESKDIAFDHPFVFKREEGVKVINGIVKIGIIPKDAKPNQNISAAENFGFSLKIMKKSAPKKLDVIGNRYIEDIWQFIDEKLTDDNQSMQIGTLFKNFMGIGGPQNYGLSRRMVQIFLLCLVKEGKVRLGIGSRSGLTFDSIDYSNISDIDFSVKVIDSFSEVRKLSKPENWEVLRPYAEKLLGEVIPSTNDDVVITAQRTKLRDLFGREKEGLERIQTRAKGLFSMLGIQNPYENELSQFVVLFSTELEGGNDIQLVLSGLKNAFGYKAFDDAMSSNQEIDDLANRLKNYQDLKGFLTYEGDLRTAHAYINHGVPDIPDLKNIKQLQQSITDKLRNLKQYIDSDIKLRTELVGKMPPDPAEGSTISTLIMEYSQIYIVLHDEVLGKIEGARNEIQKLIEGNELKALMLLEKISALQPPASEELIRKLRDIQNTLFQCDIPSRSSIEDGLRNGPSHECGLTFENAGKYLDSARKAVDEASNLFEKTIDGKIQVFMNQAVRARLKQGESDERIAELLSLTKKTDIRSFLTKKCLADDSFIGVISRYLKRIIVKPVKISNFKPTTATIEKNQIGNVVEEFERYLEEEFKNISEDGETLPMLKIE